MATASFETLIANMLDEIVENLRTDLKILEAEMRNNKDGMFITHNQEDIIVHANIRYKAYIPKKYSDLTVVFKEWDGGDLQLDLDVTIS